MKKNSIQERIDNEFADDLKRIRIERIKNGLEDDLIPLSEMTRMLRNTEGWIKLSKEELAKKPRKKQ